MANSLDNTQFGLNKIEYSGKTAARIRKEGRAGIKSASSDSRSEEQLVSQVWSWYRNNEIIQYVGGWVGKTFSNLELTIEYNGKPYKLAELPSNRVDVVESILSTLRTYNGGTEELLIYLGTNMAIAGEAYLIPIKDGYGDCYFVANRKQFSTNKNKEIEFHNVPNYVKANLRKVDNKNVVYQIIYLMPGTSNTPDSWVMGLEKMLCQYETMKEAIYTALLSQMNAPVLVYPSEVEIEQPNNLDNPDVEPYEDTTEYLDEQFAQRFAEAAEETDPIARLLPFNIGMPSEAKDLYTLNLHRNIDPGLMEGLKHAFHNILLAAPIPQENILGLGDSNHWDNAQITKDSFQKCIKPFADIIVGSLSAEIIQPILRANNIPVAEVSAYRLAYDSSPIVIPQDKTSEAMTQFKAGTISLDETRVMMSKAPLKNELGEMFHFQLYNQTNNDSASKDTGSNNGNGASD